ncbi:hypothetical protein GCM10010191_54050 [Actinomadura vinacea]|uniref:Uncharacterized protein n=1 Tax=Actinomadura vinacea TaxID=115336 RepID=A0ABN3JL17_9ACTN
MREESSARTASITRSGWKSAILRSRTSWNSRRAKPFIPHAYTAAPTLGEFCPSGAGPFQGPEGEARGGRRAAEVRDAPARVEHLVWGRIRPSPAVTAFITALGVPETALD